MINYMINFGVYTMAMAGIIIVAVLVYKKSTVIGGGKKSSLKIDDKIMLNARKSLYVVNAGGERFLIAGDMDNTSLIAKLGEGEAVSESVCTPSATKAENFADELARQARASKPFISRETEFKKPAPKKDFSEAEKSLDKAFENVAPINTNKYLDVKSIRKKPVMKELARKLAQV